MNELESYGWTADVAARAEPVRGPDGRIGRVVRVERGRFSVADTPWESA